MTQQQQQPQMSEADRIRERKKKVVETLTGKFNEEVWRERLLKICGGDESKIMKSLNSFLAYILNDDGGKKDQKVYIADCTLASISTAFLEAFQMGIEVGGGRDHAYLVNYAGNCELDISYKGFVYALNKHFDNAFVEARCVFQGDKFLPRITDEAATYEFVPDPTNIANESWERLQLCFCYFSYTERASGRKISRLIWIPRGADAKTPDSLAMIRSKAKGSFAWADFPFEQCKKSTLRRASKIPFASIDFGDEDVSPETIDNRHFELENGDSSNRLRLMMDKHREMLEDEKPDEPRGDGKPAQGATVSPTGGEAHQSDPQHQAQPGPADAGAKASTAGAAGGETIEASYQEISDADFGEPGPVIDSAPAPAPAPAPAAQAEVATLPKQEQPTEWDGKTLIIGGKHQQNDFPSPGAAAVYLKKVIGARKHKKSRLDIINENPLLIKALIRSGQQAMIDDLHKLASKGE